MTVVSVSTVVLRLRFQKAIKKHRADADVAAKRADKALYIVRLLEAMAQEFEQQSGEPEVEIRAKIATLRGVFEARDAAVAAQRTRMESALAALDASDRGSAQATEQQQIAAAASGEAAAMRASLDVATSLEASLGRVDDTLSTDPDTLSMVGGIMRGAQRRQQPPQPH